MKEAIQQFTTALLTLDRRQANRLLTDTNPDESPIKRIENLIIPALEQIGKSWETNEVSLSQVYMSGRICEELIDRLLPVDQPLHPHQPKIALTILEDYHLLGKRMVYASLRSSGYNVKDYGRTEVDTLVSQVIQDNVQILMISTLMLASALRVAKVREGLVQAGRSVHIIVGGAPFRLDKKLWKDVGADAMGQNAFDAVTLLANYPGATP